MINLDSFNPNWELATKHGKSKRAGLPPFEAADSEVINIEGGEYTLHVCPCCLESFRKEPVPMC